MNQHRPLETPVVPPVYWEEGEVIVTDFHFLQVGAGPLAEYLNSGYGLGQAIVRHQLLDVLDDEVDDRSP